MRRLCPNIDREDGLETVLEVPIPEEMFTSMGSNVTIRWENMQTWMKAQTNNKWSSSPIIAGRFNELRFLLYLVGSPLIPLQVQLGHSIHRPVKDCSIEASTAKYIVQQYTAATGGQPALNSVQSMCVTGHVRIRASDFQQGGGEDECVELKTSREEIGGFVLWQKNPDLWCLELLVPGCKTNSVQSMCVTGHVRIRASDFQQGGGEDECVELKTSREEIGGFVLWQKNPDLWCLELLVPGCKVICGSNGKVSWRHSSNQQTPISNGPPRPLRRFLQVSLSLSLSKLMYMFQFETFLDLHYYSKR
ncbi:hypothetical protein CFP56_022794 [Quercus suber]|uniref:Uncharacterized protein n=1 Tax=Quercus suber TaxID=58331 RepID=A0AAW0KBA8_QUESU